jgi:hypothetical protein
MDSYLALILFYMTTLFLVRLIVGLPFLGLYYLLPSYRTSGPVSWIFWLQEPLESVLIVGAAAWAVGNDRWKSLRQFLRVPRTNYLGLGLVIPAGIWTFIPLVTYLHDRVVWAGAGFGKVAPPWPSSYLAFPARQLFLT